VSTTGSYSTNSLTVLIAVWLQYWHTGILISKYVCAGVIHHQLCFILEMLLDKAVYYHLLYSVGTFVTC